MKHAPPAPSWVGHGLPANALFLVLLAFVVVGAVISWAVWLSVNL